jgi:hypothetical protein
VPKDVEYQKRGRVCRMVGLTPPAGLALAGNGLPHAAVEATEATAPEATEAATATPGRIAGEVPPETRRQIRKLTEGKKWLKFSFTACR